MNLIQEKQEKLVTTKQRQELTDIIEFEKNLNLKNSNNLRESDILINEIDTLESVLGRLSNLKYGGIARAIEIAEANKNLKQAKRLREQLCDIHDMESEISANVESRKR